MAPLAESLVGYLSMFLQLAVLVLVATLVVGVRSRLHGRIWDYWTLGLASYTGALFILSLGAVTISVTAIPGMNLPLVPYMAFEYLAGALFVAASRRERGLTPFSRPLLATFVLAVVWAVVDAMLPGSFIEHYFGHACVLGGFFLWAAFESSRIPEPALGRRVLTVALALLGVEYAHLFLLTLAGVTLPESYVGFDTYVTMLLDVVLGFGMVIASADEARAELERRNVALVEAEAAIRRTAFTDALCGMRNRAAFTSFLVSPPRNGVVAMIDMDNLKRINDVHGHAGGDLALRAVALWLRGITDEEHVFRIGGDEFVCVWRNVPEHVVRERMATSDADLAMIRANAVTDIAIEAPRVSYGIAAFDPDVPLEAALGRADAELYTRKAARH